MALREPGKLQFEQCRRDSTGPRAGLPDQIIDLNRAGREQFQQSRAELVDFAARDIGAGRKHAMLVWPRLPESPPRIGPSASTTSAADSIKVAPSRMRRLHPRARGSRGEPGTA